MVCHVSFLENCAVFAQSLCSVCEGKSSKIKMVNQRKLVPLWEVQGHDVKFAGVWMHAGMGRGHLFNQVNQSITSETTILFLRDASGCKNLLTFSTHVKIAEQVSSPLLAAIFWPSAAKPYVYVSLLLAWRIPPFPTMDPSYSGPPFLITWWWYIVTGTWWGARALRWRSGLVGSVLLCASALFSRSVLLIDNLFFVHFYNSQVRGEMFLIRIFFFFFFLFHRSYECGD